MGDLPSQPPVIKVFDFALQVYKVAAGPKEEGVEPGGDWFDGVFFAMPNCVSLHIQINNIWGLIGALALVIAGDSAVFQSFDPFGRVVDSITQGDVEVRHLPFVDNVAIGGPLELVFVVFYAVIQAFNLFLKAAHFDGGLGFTSGDYGEEAISDGSKNVWVKLGMGSKGCRNGIGQHRWFQTLDQSDWERDGVFGR